MSLGGDLIGFSQGVGLELHKEMVESSLNFAAESSRLQNQHVNFLGSPVRDSKNKGVQEKAHQTQRRLSN